MSLDSVLQIEDDVRLCGAYLAGELHIGPPLLERLEVANHPLGRGILLGLDAMRQYDFDQAAAIFIHLLADTQLLPAIDRTLQCIYKLITTVNLGKAYELCSRVASAAIGRHLVEPAGQRLVLEFFLYFGLRKGAEQVLAALPPTAMPEYRAALLRANMTVDMFVPRKRFSICLITWNRADLLDRSLTELKAKLASDDYEIIVGVNDSNDHTADVLAKHGIQNVLWNSKNDSTDYYRTVFGAASGEYILEVDDDNVEYPAGFDLLLEEYLLAFPDFGYIGIQPTLRHVSTGEDEYRVVADYGEIVSGDLRLHAGPVWGCCALFRNSDYRMFNGFYGVRMSKEMGEEPQIIRKLQMYGKSSGIIMGPRLVTLVP